MKDELLQLAPTNRELGGGQLEPVPEAAVPKQRERGGGGCDGGESGRRAVGLCSRGSGAAPRSAASAQPSADHRPGESPPTGQLQEALQSSAPASGLL